MTCIPVLIDCDTGIDDALALIYLAALHHATEIELVGVTTTAGNVGVVQTGKNSRWILDQCLLPDIPVVTGMEKPRDVDLVTTPETHGRYGLGYVNPQVGELPEGRWQDLWKRGLRGRADLRLIVTGPATNLAEFGPVANTTLMGGAYLYPGNTTPTAEWNSWVDPHAARRVFRQAQNPITVCSLEVTEQFTLTEESLSALVKGLGDTPIAAFLPEMLRFYFEFHELQGEGYLAQIHDLLTCMIALGKVPFTHLETTVEVEAESELMRGTTVADLRGHWGRPVNARLVRTVDLGTAHAELGRAARLLARVAEQRRGPVGDSGPAS